MRHDRITIGLLWGVLAASILIPTALFALTAWQSHEQALREAAQSAERFSQTIQRHAQNVIDTIRVTMDRVEDRIGTMTADEMRTSRALHGFLARVADDLDQVNTIVLTDADGARLVSSSEFDPASPLNLADRDFIRAFKGGHRGLFIGETVQGRRTGLVQIIIARPLLTSQGEFRGALIISASPSYFVDFFKKIAPGMNYSAALVRSDGLFIIRDAVATPSTDQPRASQNFMRVVQSGQSVAQWTGVSSVDGVQRVTVAHKLDGDLPVYALFALGTDAVLARWHEQLRRYALFAVPAMLGLVSLSALALGRTRREQRTLVALRGEMARREEAEAKLVQAQKLEALGRIAGGLAHDINNLNQVILGNLEMLRRASEERRGRLIDNALYAVKQGTRITGQLLAFGRKQALRPERTDLNFLIASMDDMLGQSLRVGIKLEVDYGDALWPVEIDQAQFQVALINLAVNARDAMTDGGTLRIATSNSISRNGNVIEGVAVTITDTGAGMTPEVLARAGEPFFSTKHAGGRGTGLGLAQVFGFIQQSGGLVEIKSEIGHGTKVTLTLPKAATSDLQRSATHTSPDEAPRPSNPIHNMGHVLLVEDNAQVAEIASAVLVEAGYQVTTTADGNSALQQLETRPFDLLFSDLVMPGMTGLELAREVRLRRPHMPILLATGYSEAAENAIREGYEVIGKPYEPTRLLGALARLIPASGPTADNVITLNSPAEREAARPSGQQLDQAKPLLL